MQGYSVQDDLSCLSIQEEEKAGEKKEEEEVQEAEVDPEEIEQEVRNNNKGLSHVSKC